MILVYSFLFCGITCMLAQIILDVSKLTPGHITSIFVVLGAILEFGGIYDFFIKNVGAGASLPITSFGHLIAHGAKEAIKTDGFMGLFSGLYSNVTVGIASTLIISFFLALMFNAKE